MPLLIIVFAATNGKNTKIIQFAAFPNTCPALFFFIAVVQVKQASAVPLVYFKSSQRPAKQPVLFALTMTSLLDISER